MGIKPIEKTWCKETDSEIDVDGLNFEATYVESINVKLESLKGDSDFHLTLHYGDKKEKLEKKLEKGEHYNFNFPNIKANCAIPVSVTGILDCDGFLHHFGDNGAEGKITVSVTGTLMKQKSASWEDETAAVSFIENLFLDNTEKWDSISLEFIGHKSHNTNIMTDVIIDDSLKQRYNFSLGKGEKRVELISGIDKQVPILVSGKISKDALLTGAGATINLIGTYKEESLSVPTLPDLTSDYEAQWEIASFATKINDGKIDEKYLTTTNLKKMGLTEVINVFECGIDAGFVARATNGDLCICFRGTDGKEDWLNDAKFDLEPFFIEGNQYGEVHKGFLKSVNNVIGIIQDQIEKDEINIKFYGHSKGGAMATLAAKIIEVTESEKSIEVITFASPRVGNYKFKESYSLKHTRYELFLDLIPHAPFTKDEGILCEDIGLPSFISDVFPSITDYVSVGDRVLLISRNYNTYNVKTPYVTTMKEEETLNSFVAILDLLRNNIISSFSVINKIHNSYSKNNLI